MADDNLYSDEDLIDIPDEELNAISSVCVTAASITEFFVMWIVAKEFEIS